MGSDLDYSGLARVFKQHGLPHSRRYLNYVVAAFSGLLPRRVISYKRVRFDERQVRQTIRHLKRLAIKRGRPRNPRNTRKENHDHAA